MAVDTKKKFLPVRSRSYLNKDFDSLRAQLLEYAKTYFPDRISDFSEASVGGMFLDFASFVGDNLSFYLDHQFSELDPSTAVEVKNIERMLRSAGIKITGNSPAVATVRFTIEAPAKQVGSLYVPDESTLPQILKGTIATSQSGISFELTEDVDFAKTDRSGNLVANVTIATTTTANLPNSFFLSVDEVCISGARKTETFTIGNSFVPFRQISLSKPNITEIISIKDTQLNDYYEVESLTQDTVFVAMTNINIDNDLVKENMEMKPAPYRFITETGFNSKKTKITFGSGDANTLDDDIVPDPSEFAVPLYGKRSFSRFSIDPNDLLKTKTLGVSPQNTTLSVLYRHGGGLDNNVSANTIRTITSLSIKFPNSPSSNGARLVRSSIKVTNPNDASGGEDAPTLNDLKLLIPASRNAQSRIVTTQDLLARVYTMPSNFGRVYRASVRANPNNPLATLLFIISRNNKGNLIVSPDSLKKNLTTYLNEFRMISDAVDILDAQVVNLQLRFSITVDDSANKTSVIQQIISKLKNYFQIKNFQIDQVIAMNDIQNIIFNTSGVMAITEVKFYGLTGTYKGREYTDIMFNVAENSQKGILFPPMGGIFEIRYPNFDIIGSAN